MESQFNTQNTSTTNIYVSSESVMTKESVVAKLLEQKLITVHEAVVLLKETVIIKETSQVQPQTPVSPSIPNTIPYPINPWPNPNDFYFPWYKQGYTICSSMKKG